MAAFVDVYPKPSKGATQNSAPIHLKSVNEQVLRRHSRVARDQLNKGAQIGWKSVTTCNTSANRTALVFVLDRMIRDGSKINISMHNRNLAEAIEIYEALEALEAEPKHCKLERNLEGYKSYRKWSTADVAAIARTFERGSDLWISAIHHLALWLIYRCQTVEEYDALVAECEKHPNLNQTILAKMRQLEHEKEAKAAKECEAAKKKATLVPSATRHRNADRFEETSDVRETSERMVDWIIQKKTVYKVTDRTRSKKPFMAKKGDSTAAEKGDGDEDGEMAPKNSVRGQERYVDLNRL